MTVRELIVKLKELDQDRVVCAYDDCRDTGHEITHIAKDEDEYVLGDHTLTHGDREILAEGPVRGEVYD